MTCGVSLFFSGFAFSAQGGPQEGRQAPLVEDARKINPSAVEVLLGGCRVATDKLQRSGFTFRHPRLEGALCALLGKTPVDPPPEGTRP